MTTARMSLLAPACLFAAIALVTTSFAQAPDGAGDKKAMAGHSAGSMELHQVMAKGHMSMPMSGNVDKDFAMMMSMHHQQAIDMINVFAKHGQSAELKAMAMKMKTAQTEEIKQLARFAGPMDHAKMMDHGKMDHAKMMDHGTMDHSKMPMDHATMAATEFAKLDQNKDGRLARAEVPKTHPLSAHFDMLDGNKDGSLSKAEFDKHHGM